MTFRTSFHQLAELELKEAAQYYESEVAGLGKTFVDEVEHTLKQIALHPEAALMIHDVVHRKLVRRFPYSIMYSIVDDTIRILAIANQKRRPFYWRVRK